jgi:uncharacterized protein
MRQWSVSSYTMLVPGAREGNALLYNSFMGALARIDAAFLSELVRRFGLVPGKYRPDTQPSVDERAIEADPRLIELARGGFLVPVDLNERNVVSEVLAKERDYAFHLIILPHEDCNFRCTYCYETFERGKMEPGVAASLKALVERRASEFKAVNVGWFGGEPCLALDVIYDLSDAFQRTCARTGAAYRASMTTNGYFLSASTVDRLIAASVSHFQVTLDGARDDHDQVRKLRGGQPTFERILGNLRAMATRDDDFSVAIRVNFSRPAMQRIGGFLEELVEPFANDSRFFLDFHAMGRWGGPNDASLEVVDGGSAAGARLSLMGQAHCRGFPATASRDALQPHGSVCYAGKETSMVVGSDGRLYKCTVAFNDPRNHVGWLRPGGVLDIDQAKWHRWINPVSASGKCGSCTFGAACQSRACPLAAMDEGEPPCPYTETELADLIHFAAEQASGAAGERDRRRYWAE